MRKTNQRSDMPSSELDLSGKTISASDRNSAAARHIPTLSSDSLERALAAGKYFKFHSEKIEKDGALIAPIITAIHSWILSEKDVPSRTDEQLMRGGVAQ